MSKVLVIISTGFEEIEAISIIDILRRAQIEVTISTINDILTVGANSIAIQANQKLVDIKDFNSFDMIVLPGGGLNCENLANSQLVKDVLRQMKNDKKYISAICASPYVLHEANVLNEKYTCYPSFEKRIDSASYIENQNVVIDKKVITSKGPATAMEFSLELVKTLEGEEVYSEIKNGLLATNF